MKSKLNIILLISVLILTISSCSNNSNKNKSSTETTKEQTTKASEFLQEYLGNYHGIQPSYFMKNQYGDDMVLNGNKVLVPSSDFKFLIKENGIVSLQQTNLEDNSRYYYNGTATIKKEDAKTYVVECSLSDGKSSNPTYTLTIVKSDKTGTCIGNNEPQFKLEKIK